MKWENTYLVFEVAKGPKVIIDTLNTYGDDGWECCSQLIVAGSQIVCFLKRRTDIDEEPKVDKETKRLANSGLMVNKMSVLAIDLETKNMSYDIGGFNNTHMFQVSTVATWDGNTGTVYLDEPVESFAKSGHIVKSLSELKYDLDEHFEKGGLLLGHNIKAFDLPILRDSMDIYCINKYITEKNSLIHLKFY